ncbi:MAG TPA: apolipoprotein N-acyltransferase, partial [Armatimonadota bacterium]|nr:apolipoprotein N-acyltransferase [Armatimonadota bacterium]
MQQRESLAVADLSPWRIVLALASGLLLAFSFPPLDLGWLAWLAIAPLLIAIRGLRPAQGFTLGLLCGFVYFGILLHYIHGVSTTIPWIALILFQSLFLSIFGFLAAVMWRCPSPWIRIPALGAAWTAHEIIRGNFGPLGFTFGHLGYSQHRLLWVLQLASLGGHYGLGFAIATFQAALVEAIPRFDYRGRPATGGPLVILTSLLVAACIWGGARVSRQRDLVLKGSLDVTAVQGNIDYSAEDGYDQLVDLSAARYIVRSQNDGAGSDLIVWPETAIPIPLESFPDTREWIASTAKRINSHIFVGVAETAPGGSRYNSMWVIDPNGDKIATYRKRYLVIFGEYVPFREQLPWLAKFPIRSFDFLPGRADLVLPINGIRVSPMICFEGTFPQISRRLVQKGAEMACGTALTAACTAQTWWNRFSSRA